MRRLILAWAIAALGMLSSPADAQENFQDEIDPRLLRPFWLGTPFQLRSQYDFTMAEQKKFGGSFGLDLSHYTVDRSSNPECRSQENYNTSECSCSIEWKTVSSLPLVYVMTKSSDGGGRDLSFGKIWSELKSFHEAGTFYRGAYHFLRPGISAEKQADAFLAALEENGGKTAVQLPPTVDIEWSNKRIIPGTSEFNSCPKSRRTQDARGRDFCDMWYKMSSHEIVDLAKKWIEIVSKATGKPVMIYTNSNAWWNPVLGSDGEELAKSQAFWDSRYVDNGPVYNKKWTAKGGSPKWSMPPPPQGASWGDEYKVANYWQFSESGSLPGPLLICDGKKTPKNVDMNWFPLARTDYEKLLNLTH